MSLSIRSVVPCAAGVLALGLVGCATPAPIVRLNPDSANVFWVSGRPSVAMDNAGVRVAAAFEHQDGGNLSLRVEVLNQTPTRLEIGPQDITFAVCKSQLTTSCLPSQHVIDPEQMLNSLDVAQSRNTAEAANTAALDGTLTILAAVGDVSSHHGGGDTAVAVDNMQANAASYDSAQAGITFQQRLWANKALRRNTLDPGQGTSGLVFVPIYMQAGFVWLQVTVAGHVFPFHFAQTVTQVTMPAPPTTPSNIGPN